MEKGEIISAVITGFYTLVFVVVFIIQRSQIKKVQATANSMKDFMEIFKLDEIKKYVEIKEESANLQAVNLLMDDARVKEIMEKGVHLIQKDLETTGAELLGKQFKEEQTELIRFAREMIEGIPREHRNAAIKKYFLNTKRFFEDLIVAETGENE